MTPYIYDFLTTDTNDTYNFNKISLNWYKNKLIINFKEDGFATETFIAINCYKNSNQYVIKYIYIESLDFDDCTVKDLVWIDIINIKYVDFINWITNQGSYTNLHKSGDYTNLTIIGLEIYFLTVPQGLNKYPSKLGCQIISNSILTL